MSSSSTINCYASTVNTDTSRRPKSKESDQQNRKKKKHQRNRLNKRCKNQRQKINTIQPSSHHAIFTTNHWTWKTSRTKTFSERQNRQLFKRHSICNKIEERKTAIFNSQFITTTLRSKDHKGNISTTTVTSSATSSSESSNAIKPLKDEI